ncbi:MAG: flavin reductase [Acidiferrobacteraceae bacterium]|nr:flavin reductase [Acidiferrobacteraceae bacterium]
MFYQPKNNNHGLPKNPFNSLIVPRPIGWISSVDTAGNVNLAPYSFFNAVSYKPPAVMFAAGSRGQGEAKKDTVKNIEHTKEFVCNIVTVDTAAQMNMTSASVDGESDEMALAELTAVPSILVAPPRVAEAPVHLECSYIQTIEMPWESVEERYVIVLGEVIGIHISEAVITEEGFVDIARIEPVGRLGYDDYTRIGVDTVFTMIRPS